MNIILRRRKLGNGSSLGIRAASTTGIAVQRNDLPWDGHDLTQAGYIFRWGCTSNLPTGLSDAVTVVNSAKAIHWCSNKKQGRIDMQAAGVSVPETWTVPDFLRMPADCDYEGDSFVLRRAQHAQGRDLWHGSIDEIITAVHTNSVQDGYVSLKIDKVAEYRVAVISGRVAWVAQKTPGNPDDVAWNVARGGKFTNVRWKDWPRAVVEQGLKAAKVSGTDFCGVDVMVDADGKAYVLEVNSAPSQTSPYRQQCFAKCFDYIVNNGKEHFPMPEKFGWKSTIHPALTQE